MNLKFKAKFYQYTGIYLAKKEELDFLASSEFWDEFDKLRESEDFDDCGDKFIQSMILGSWQADNGFYRSWNSCVLSGNPFVRFYGNLKVFFKQLRQDIEYAFNKKK